MKMSARQKQLVAFAEFVLQVLEEDRQWDADTIDRIGLDPIHRGLATTDAEHQFVRIKP